jgi:hypothetical protein
MKERQHSLAEPCCLLGAAYFLDCVCAKQLLDLGDIRIYRRLKSCFEPATELEHRAVKAYVKEENANGLTKRLGETERRRPTGKRWETYRSF